MKRFECKAWMSHWTIEMRMYHLRASPNFLLESARHTPCGPFAEHEKACTCKEGLLREFSVAALPLDVLTFVSVTRPDDTSPNPLHVLELPRRVVTVFTRTGTMRGVVFPAARALGGPAFAFRACTPRCFVVEILMREDFLNLILDTIAGGSNA